MSELLDLARAIVERGGVGEEIEAYVTHERDFQVKVFDGAVESLASAEPRGAGARVIIGGRTGFAYTTDLSNRGLDEVVTRSRENARFSTPDEAVALAGPWVEEPKPVQGLIDPELKNVSAEMKIALAIELERATRAHDPRVRGVEEAMYADSISTISLATSNGVAGTYERTDAWCYAIAIATDGDDTEVGFEFDLSRGMSSLDPEGVARGAAERAVGVLGATKIPSAVMPVVFDPYTAGQVLGVLGAALTGEAAQKGRSLFAGRLGESVAAPGLTLVDDGRAVGAPGAAPWDAEGVPTGRTEVILAGTLNSFLYDTVSARRDERVSTGNATRAGFKSVPHPSPSNLAFDPTGESRDELLQRAGRAFLVQDLHGVHSGANSISGDFSVGATGRLIENGILGRSVKEVTIAAPLLDILRRVEAVADDRRWLPFGGSYGGATTLVSEMTVAGS